MIMPKTVPYTQGWFVGTCSAHGGGQVSLPIWPSRATNLAVPTFPPCLGEVATLQTLEGLVVASWLWGPAVDKRMAEGDD